MRHLTRLSVEIDMRRFTPLLTDTLQWLVIVLACLMAVTRPAKGAAQQRPVPAVSWAGTGLMHP